ncbi:hypothetical protein B0T19DRAFT_281583 [Cercophora scortea]|uniref:Cyanovirin-N domain-containing protein n=1 Tax=Cercophora scortea TaxID=314031 RepID=A0AAE0M6W4_9PEZI|nr:hypothetical protein B0T19DRAFT_281583 [Cercophora scortea]
MQLSTISRWVAVIPALATAVAAYGNFSHTCQDIELVNTDVRATCLDEAASTLYTNELDLNLCVGLDQTTAQLKWELLGKFSLYCVNCALAWIPAPLLTCSCAPLTGGAAHNTTLDLDDGVGNSNGTLTCRTGQGVPASKPKRSN